MKPEDSILRVDEYHADLLAQLHGACFAPAWDAASFRGLLLRPGCLAFVAPPGVPRAFVLVQIAADQCEILSIGTLPEARRGGFARLLLHTAATEAAERGAREMFLEVAEDNHAARALYQGCGFAEAGRRRGYYRAQDGHVSDALTLRAALPLRHEARG
jgi:[ribosomal protein S18]-alanine N-acetyltransferase